MTRQQTLEQLQGTPVWDLLVVGGGATGLGVALEAARRGWRVALLESHDFASGTSSRSTKLLHGGVRYLAQGNLTLVREALAERQAVLHIAPHLAQPLPFVMPCYRPWQAPFYGLGLKLYDWLAGSAGLGRTRWLDREQALEALPGVQAQGLLGGIQYWDAQFEDARLALALARSAEAAGAVLLNYVEVQQVQNAQAPATTQGGGLLQVQALDRHGGGRLLVQARCVVNATGVWVDGLRQGMQPAAAPLVQPSQGVHLVVARDFLPGQQALLVPRTADGRVLFAVPWLGALVLGSTDTPRTDLPREPEPFEAEIEFILREASLALARPVRRTDVKSVWVGLRPLVAPASAGASTKSLSREHRIVVDRSGLVTVTGGKWTTFRAMASDVLAHCVEAGLLDARAALVSPPTPLCGAVQGPHPPLHQAPGLHLYGKQAAAVQALPGAGRMLGMGLSEAMVRYAVRHEWALNVEDVLARRWRALFLDTATAEGMAADVAQIVQDELQRAGASHTDPQLPAFVALAQRYRLR
ncbi:glycerol-3-phosphate dehydrogenase/oxidase [Serpentinimonas barnesii]|uniref:glycerol-3-phosphate dehydrogenase/oxidase n=1 Tax=Serpentinimonas barnesii TaxID=1458427 RepID=UPI000497DF58|nr:glycerol-3-phosphate dehydrogenase/oxidase [Serpentinimonas barnesii]